MDRDQGCCLLSNCPLNALSHSILLHLSKNQNRIAFVWKNRVMGFDAKVKKFNLNCLSLASQWPLVATHHHSQWIDWTLFHGQSFVFSLLRKKIGHSCIDTPFCYE